MRCGTMRPNLRILKNREELKCINEYTLREYMKLKVKITGPKLHGVGYRPYLTELAMRMGIERL